MAWFYISFCDTNRPTGSQFVGCCFVHALDECDALKIARERGCNPGGEAMIASTPTDKGAPPTNAQHILIRTPAELEALTKAWLGDEGSKVETIAEREARDGLVNVAYACQGCNE